MMIIWGISLEGGKKGLIHCWVPRGMISCFLSWNGDSYLSVPPADPFKPFIIFSNRHEIRRIDLNKGEFSVLVPGLRNTIALDFHLSQNTLYWTDVVEDKIYRGKLSENGGEPPLTAIQMLHAS